jgi:ABC-type dipeptide/oligopeptide/nickel transport system permease subunit
MTDPNFIVFLALVAIILSFIGGFCFGQVAGYIRGRQSMREETRR